jgi:hypothetical protein
MADRVLTLTFPGDVLERLGGAKPPRPGPDRPEPRPTYLQRLRRRNEEWLRRREAGVPVGTIAFEARVTAQAVRDGLRRARGIREARADAERCQS